MKRVSLIFALFVAISFGTLTACQQNETAPETTEETETTPEPEATTAPQSSVETPEEQAVENSSDAGVSATPVVSPAGETSEVSQPVLIEETSEMGEVESGIEEDSLSTEEIEPTLE